MSNFGSFFFFLSVCNICLSVSLFICESVYPSVSICVSVCCFLSLCLSLSLCLYLSVCLSLAFLCVSHSRCLCLSVCMPACLSVFLSIHRSSVCLSLPPFIHLPKHPLLPARPPLSLTIYLLSLHVFIHASMHVCMHVSVHSPVRPCSCVSVCLSSLSLKLL